LKYTVEVVRMKRASLSVSRLIGRYTLQGRNCHVSYCLCHSESYLILILMIIAVIICNRTGFWVSCGGDRPPLWSSGQSSWLQIQRSRVRYPVLIFWEVVGLERGPLSHVSTVEKLLGRNSSRSGRENREYGRGDPLRWPRDILYPQKLALTSLASGGRSVGIVRLLAKGTEFFFCGGDHEE
jgi:hypothetical protein